MFPTIPYVLFCFLKLCKFSENALKVLFQLLEIDNILGDLPGDAEVDHPVHEVEGEEHDGEDDSAVLVDITGSHAEYPCGWLSRGRRKSRYDGLRRKEGSIASSTPVVSLVISWQCVVTVIHSAGQHAARVEPHARLKSKKGLLQMYGIFLLSCGAMEHGSWFLSFCN